MISWSPSWPVYSHRTMGYMVMEAAESIDDLCLSELANSGCYSSNIGHFGLLEAHKHFILIRFLGTMSPLVTLVCPKMATSVDYSSKIGHFCLQTTLYNVFRGSHFKWRSISGTPSSSFSSCCPL